MARARTDKGYESKVERLLEGAIKALEYLDTTPCPLCGQKTLQMEFVKNSGVNIQCSGLSEEDEELTCSYHRMRLYTVEAEMPVMESPEKA